MKAEERVGGSGGQCKWNCGDDKCRGAKNRASGVHVFSVIKRTLNFTGQSLKPAANT